MVIADHWANPDEYDAMIKEMRQMRDQIDAADKQRDALADALERVLGPRYCLDQIEAHREQALAALRLAGRLP